MVDSNKENYVMTDKFDRIQSAIIKTQQRNYALYKGVNTVGRNKSAIINLKNLNVSQNHAVIVIVDDTQHFISDLNSSNGTYLLGTRLSPYKLYELVNDVELKFGDVTAFYSKVSRADTTIHLQSERNDMTQDMTQSYYGAGTQLMINESLLNQTGPDNMSRKSNVDLEDIHEAETQVVVRVSANADQVTENSNHSDTTLDDDIHQMPTQAVDYKLATTSAFTCNTHAEKTDEMDIHEMETQVVSLPRDIDKAEEEPEELNIHDMQTQVLPRHLNEPDDDQEINVPEADRVSSDKFSESTNEDVPKPEWSPSNEKTEEKINSETESNELFANMETTSNIEETVIEETVIDETHIEMGVNEDSNGSIDFLTIQKPENEQGRETNLANDNDSIMSESQDVGVIRKRPARKLSSSEDWTQSRSVQTTYNSDSDTDIENEIKAAQYKTPAKEAIDSGSDTEIESDFQEQPKKKTKILSSDSETDVDEPISYNDNPTKSSNVVNNKDASITVSEIEQEKRIPEIDADKEFLNDTDCIPATQDAFANVFAYGGSKISRSNPDSQNASSEESFKLGLTELMLESENKIDDTEEAKMSSEINEEGTTRDKAADKSNDQLLKNDEEEGPAPKAIESKTDEELYMDPTQKICTDDPKEECRITLAAGHSKTSVISEEECKNEKPTADSKSSITSEETKEAQMADDDIYLMATQKLNEEGRRNEESPTSKKDNAGGELPNQDHNKNNEPEFKTPKKKYSFRKKQINLDWSLSNIFNKTKDDPCSASPQKLDKDEDNADDIYLQPTQKLNEEQKTQDLYMQPTQELYMQPTQDLYMQPTQDLYMQPTQDIKLTAAHHDEDFYMAPTQEINLGKVNTTESKTHSPLEANQSVPSTSGTSKKTEENDEDLYMAATQPINPTSGGGEEKDRKSVMDLYLQETQDLGFGNQRKVINLEQDEKHKEICKMQKPQSTELTGTTTAESIEKDVEDARFAMTQPIKPTLVDTEKKKVPLESVTAPHVQEALGANENEDIEDPYMMPTQQINQNVVEDSNATKTNSKISMPPAASKNEISLITKRRMRSDFSTPDLRRQKEDSGESTPTDTFIRKPLSKKKPPKPEASPSIQITKAKATVDQSETLSQIQRFLVETSDHSKKPKAKTLPKKRTSTEAQMDAQSETLSQIEAFVKQPLTNIKENIATPSKRRKGNESVKKIEQPVEEFQKPERNVRSRRTKTTDHSKTHLSKEDCGISNDSEVGPSTSKDVEMSFALLEAKSTKTRKSQRVVNSKEVKVALRENRRSMATSAMPVSSSDSESRPIKKSRKTSPNTRSCNAQNSSSFTSPEKGKRKQKPKVVFTMLDSPILETLIRHLGGSVVDSVEASTVLVTGQVKRSQKLLTAVGQGKPICSPEWIHASKKANEFLDPWDYILLDKEAESKWDFSLKESLTRAGNKKLLDGYTFQVIVDNAEDVLKGAIKACSGKCVPRCPARNVGEKFLVIASPENKSKCAKMRKQHPQVRIVKPEAIFDGVLRQELRLDMHTLE